MDVRGLHPEEWATEVPWRGEQLRAARDEHRRGEMSPAEALRDQTRSRRRMMREIESRGHLSAVSGRGHALGILLTEICMAGQVNKFREHGRQVYKVPAHVADLFEVTSLEDVRYGDLRLPFRSFYVWFEDSKLETMTKWGDPAVVSGVYVSGATLAAGEAIQANFVLARKGAAEWPLNVGGIVPMLLVSPDPERCLLDVIEDTGRRQRAEINDRMVLDGFQGRFDFNAEFAADLDQVRNAFLVLANALTLINAMPEEVEPDTSNLPDRIRRELATGEAHRVARSERRIDEAGYSRISIVGPSLRSAESRAAGQPATKEVSPHMRTPHWRRQRFGPNLSQTRSIRIEGVHVRKDLGPPRKGSVREWPDASGRSDRVERSGQTVIPA